MAAKFGRNNPRRSMHAMQNAEIRNRLDDVSSASPDTRFDDTTRLPKVLNRVDSPHFVAIGHECIIDSTYDTIDDCGSHHFRGNRVLSSAYGSRGRRPGHGSVGARVS
jgi:hypothetical protein